MEAGRELGPEDFLDPIEFLYGEHERLRRQCEHLVRLAKDPVAAEAPEIAAAILDYLENNLPLHRADEEEDLFPLLERRTPAPALGSHDELLSSL
jgi:iron-sulfur cluster repair protein YtfE (RIC family)